jgi:hypothetical protein
MRQLQVNYRYEHVGDKYDIQYTFTLFSTTTISFIENFTTRPSTVDFDRKSRNSESVCLPCRNSKCRQEEEDDDYSVVNLDANSAGENFSGDAGA